MRRRGWYLLLILPFIGTLLPPLYNHARPALFGLPFFYWYQLAWVRRNARRSSASSSLSPGKPTCLAPALFWPVAVAAVTLLGFLAARWGTRKSRRPRAVGARAAAASGRSSPGSCWAATSTPPTPSSPCRRSSTASAPWASSPSRTRRIAYPIALVVLASLLEDRAPARLRDGGGFRPRPVRRSGARDRDRADRSRGGDAVHRAAARRDARRLRSVRRARRRPARCPRSPSRSFCSPPYTYTSGLRAPALIAFVKDTLIYAHGHRGDRRDSGAPRRLVAHLRGLGRARSPVGRAPSSHLPRAVAVLYVRDDGVRVGAFALHLSALDHERACGAQPRGDPAQRRLVADLFAAARPTGAARVLRRRRGHRREGCQQRRAAALRALLSRSGSAGSRTRRS